MGSTQNGFDELDGAWFDLSPKLERRIALLRYVAAVYLLLGTAAILAVSVLVGEVQAWLVALALGPIVGLVLAGLAIIGS